MDVLRTELAEVRVEAVIRSGLHEYLDGLQTKMNLIGDRLTQDFFALRSEKRATGRSSQWQKSEGVA
jgi:uncharacterized alpha-E superfamily protein